MGSLWVFISLVAYECERVQLTVVSAISRWVAWAVQETEQATEQFPQTLLQFPPPGAQPELCLASLDG